MAVFSEEQQRTIIEALRSRGAIYPCPRCGNNEFNLIDGYISNQIQDNLWLSRGVSGIPSVATYCTRCGYLSQHALGVLGLLPPSPGRT